MQEVVPTFSFTAVPLQEYILTPQRTYYIATTSFEVGTLVEVAQLGQKVEIDFTGKTSKTAVVTMNEDNSYG